ncbi:hypothetical protein E2C01_101283 [Portunus trituberculatus]|uniref:Uncharacterized protein n=1 Tax=Portunus trituberculatus TaxID=210409 RepID=A0A5B7KLK6_PORTR|nr:hypothetical protein [Portunus trituberculatus]
MILTVYFLFSQDWSFWGGDTTDAPAEVPHAALGDVAHQSDAEVEDNYNDYYDVNEVDIDKTDDGFGLSASANLSADEPYNTRRYWYNSTYSYGDRTGDSGHASPSLTTVMGVITIIPMMMEDTVLEAPIIQPVTGHGGPTVKMVTEVIEMVRMWMID